ncbi:hypothetical protein HPQ32_14005 [Photobacterium carnosum]|uniref:hypothetical protein n=1 Tax=Photobacterium carnosum TaxID=2023717 RepID=UPI001C91B48A|nr:hypothetical protein [Photobacterium carnosum]MBY3789537.1 hypothetical protein [Photobacterium carnosum]MCD9534596.1 hypothetical protein [Photobacterium carnosum]
MTAKLKGYSAAQRNLAHAIRQKVIKNYPWQEAKPDRLLSELECITSPMFFIKYQKQLISGNIKQALTDYGNNNYARRVGYATGKRNGF